jgi:ABC-type sulfate transport system permease component
MSEMGMIVILAGAIIMHSITISSLIWRINKLEKEIERGRH